MTPTVAWIHIAPIKSLQIEERRRVQVGRNGIANDRQFGVVDANDRWVSAKHVGALVSVRPEFDEAFTSLTLHLPGSASVRGGIALAEPLQVAVWDRVAPAHVVEGPWARALSTLVDRPLRLVRFDEPSGGIDRADQGGGVTVLSVAALDALAEAAQADGPVDPRRFRMQFGVSGVAAHEEDTWLGRRVTIGEAVVVPTGNVGRCAVTTLDPRTGVRDLDTLGALARYRGAVATTERLAFGVWARVERPGAVAVGDAVRL